MRHEQNCFRVAQPYVLELEVQFVARHGIKRTEGFVHEQKCRIEQQCAADRHALPHAARQFPRAPMLKSSQTDQFEQGQGLGFPLVNRQLLEFAGKQNVVDDVQPIEQDVALENESHVERGGVDGLPPQRNRALAWVIQSGDATKQRALAATTRTKNADEFPAFDRDVDILESRHAPASPRIGLIDSVDADVAGSRHVFERGDLSGLAHSVDPAATTAISLF